MRWLMALLVGILLSLALAESGTIQMYSADPSGRCVGADPCSACKNCKYCKHCAKDHGTCGTCKKR